MPPKRADDLDDDDDPQRTLDSNIWVSAQGGFLTTLHGDVEEKVFAGAKA